MALPITPNSTPTGLSPACRKRLAPLEWLRYWHGDGAFVAIYTPEDAKLTQRIGIPIVNLATHFPNLQTPSITMDHYAIGELAARHLL